MTTKEITPESVLENLRYQGLESVMERIDRFQFTAAVLYRKYSLEKGNI